MLPLNHEIVFNQGDAAANEEHRGGKATKTQVPALDLWPAMIFHPISFVKLLLMYLPSWFVWTGANAAFWALWPISWSLPRPLKRSSETLTAKGISRSGKWSKSFVSIACIHYVLLRYLTLVTCMGESIVRIAQEHGKTPQAVVKMENYHRLHATLSRLKIPVLDSIRWFSFSCMALSVTASPKPTHVILI